MSWGTCYKTQNNIHHAFPGIMSDGRLFTDYNPNAVMNKKVSEMNKIKSNEDYRKYLTNNANQIMNYNLSMSTLENNCKVNSQTEKLSGNNPYLYHHSMEKAQPYGYEDSSLKNKYLERQELNMKKMSPYH